MTIPLLNAPGPQHAHAEAMMLYGRLVGTWDIQARQLVDGAWREAQGEWHFGWGLEGLAVIDVIHSPTRAGLTRGNALADIGMTIRVYDPEMAAWQITFVTAVGRRVEQLTGRRVGDDIHQDGTGSDGRPIRWNFTDITTDSCRWRGYVSDDTGKTWLLNEEMRLRR